MKIARLIRGPFCCNIRIGKQNLQNSFNRNRFIANIYTQIRNKILILCTDHVIYFPQKTATGGNKTQGSNTIMSTSFALEFWSNKLIDVNIILSFTLTAS